MRAIQRVVSAAAITLLALPVAAAANPGELNDLAGGILEDPAYRKWFKKQWESLFLPKAFHREASAARCPAPDR